MTSTPRHSEAAFETAHELNPELEDRYAKNRLGLTRQLRYSTRRENSLDVTLSVNGIPIATLVSAAYDRACSSRRSSDDRWSLPSKTAHTVSSAHR